LVSDLIVSLRLTLNSTAKAPTGPRAVVARGFFVWRKGSDMSYPDLRVVYDSDELHPCGHKTLFVPISKLVQKYPGGLQGFVEKHGAYCSRHLAGVAVMFDEDLYPVFDDLIKTGFALEQDFCVILHGWGVPMEIEAGFTPSTGVDWLEYDYTDKRVCVRYIGKD